MDRAALDAALALGIPAADGVQRTEGGTTGRIPSVTRWRRLLSTRSGLKTNVEDSRWTPVLSLGPPKGGTVLAPSNWPDG